MTVRRGYLLTTDISGYTRFLVESELQHAKEILDTLLSTTIASIKAPVTVLNTRGDAVLAYVAETNFLQPQSLLESMREIYFDFHRRLSFMDLNTTCECNACANIGGLDLKVFLHHGDYIEQDLDGNAELQGADVILANLLMKNHVKEALRLEGYGLITDQAVEAMGAQDLVDTMTPHHETYEHFGHVPVRVWDLHREWIDEQARNRRTVEVDSKWVVESVGTPAPQWTAWDVATDKDQKRIYYDMLSVDRVDSLGGRVREGSQYHCVHELGDVRFTITDWDPPHSFQSDEVAFDIPVHFTMQFVPTESGTTIRIMYDEPAVDGDAEELKPLFVDAARDALSRLRGLLTDRA